MHTLDPCPVHLPELPQFCPSHPDPPFSFLSREGHLYPEFLQLSLLPLLPYTHLQRDIPQVRPCLPPQMPKLSKGGALLRQALASCSKRSNMEVVCAFLCPGHFHDPASQLTNPVLSSTPRQMVKERIQENYLQLSIGLKIN